MSETVSDRPAVLEWFSRDPGLPVISPARLASMVDGALDRADRVLFTVTPREELDVSAPWQRIADQAWCGQLRHVVACTARLSGTDRDVVGDELALALGLSPLTGRALEQCQAVALIALARYVDQTPSGWAELVRRLVVTIDPHAAARRRQEKTALCKARFFPQADEQGAMWLHAPAAQLARVQARLDAEAARLKAAGDERTSDQLVCDVALALLADGKLDGQDPARFEVHVVVPLSVLEDQPAEDDSEHPTPDRTPDPAHRHAGRHPAQAGLVTGRVAPSPVAVPRSSAT